MTQQGSREAQHKLGEVSAKVSENDSKTPSIN